jgi:hypothetical protein
LIRPPPLKTTITIHAEPASYRGQVEKIVRTLKKLVASAIELAEHKSATPALEQRPADAPRERLVLRSETEARSHGEPHSRKRFKLLTQMS